VRYRKILDLDAGVGLHERLDHRLGVALLKETRIGHQRDGLLGDGRLRQEARGEDGSNCDLGTCLHAISPVLLFTEMFGRHRHVFASLPSTMAVAPEISGSFSPLRNRSSVTISRSCIPMARRAVASAPRRLGSTHPPF